MTTNEYTAGQAATLAIPMGRVRVGTTRMEYRSQAVTIVGPVNFEPSMLRVRLADGSVTRVMTEHLTPAPRKAA